MNSMPQSEAVSWKRLPLLALLFFLMSSLRLAVKQGYQALPALVPMFIFLEKFRTYLPLIAAVGLLVLVVATVLRYLRFFYAVERHSDGDRVRVRQGVFNHTDLSLGFDRIQQADVYQPFYLRPFELAVLKLQSAGSKAQEVEIAGLPLAWSRELQQEILKQSSGTRPASGAASTPDDSAISFPGAGAPDFELNLPPTEILRVGLMQNVLLVFAVLAGVVFSNQHFNDYVESKIEAYIEGFEALSQAILVMSLWVAAGIVVLVLGTVIFYFNQFYNYRLTRHGDKYQYKAGLLSSLSRSFRVYKLQYILVRQGIMGRLIRRRSMRISQAGGFAAMRERFTIPVLNQQNLRACATDLQLPEPRWHSVHWALATRYILVPAIAAFVLLNLWQASVITLFLIWIRYRWWKRFQWHYDGKWLGLKTGIFSDKLQWIPAEKAQVISLYRGPVQRLFGLATLRVAGASGTIEVACMKETDAVELKQELVNLVAASRKRWM